MNITSASREDIKVYYTIGLEHEGKSYTWEASVSEDDATITLFDSVGFPVSPLPEWLEDEDFFDLYEQAGADL